MIVIFFILVSLSCEKHFNYKNIEHKIYDLNIPDAIEEIDEQDMDQNDDEESFLGENNSLLIDMKDQSSIDMNLSCYQQDNVLSTTTNEESLELINRLKKYLLNQKVKSHLNNTVIENKTRKDIFYVVKNENTETHIKNSYNIYNNKISYLINQLNQTNFTNCQVNNNTSLANNLNNLSQNNNSIIHNNNNANLSLECKNNSLSNINSISNIKFLNKEKDNIIEEEPMSNKRGRRKFLIEGVKTEVIDRGFLRKFKEFAKKNKFLSLLSNSYLSEEFGFIFTNLSQEEKLFWNEFITMGSSPPFKFTVNGVKAEYKSFSKSLMNYIFNLPSVSIAYELFIKDKEMEIASTILSKRSKTNDDKKIFLYYSYYGRHLHKIYSRETLDIDLIDGLFDYSENMTYSSQTNNHTEKTVNTFSTNINTRFSTSLNLGLKMSKQPQKSEKTKNSTIENSSCSRKKSFTNNKTNQFSLTNNSCYKLSFNLDKTEKLERQESKKSLNYSNLNLNMIGVNTTVTNLDNFSFNNKLNYTGNISLDHEKKNSDNFSNIYKRNKMQNKLNLSNEKQNNYILIDDKSSNHFSKKNNHNTNDPLNEDFLNLNENNNSINDISLGKNYRNNSEYFWSSFVNND